MGTVPGGRAVSPRRGAPSRRASGVSLANLARRRERFRLAGGALSVPQLATSGQRDQTEGNRRRNCPNRVCCRLGYPLNSPRRCLPGFGRLRRDRYWCSSRAGRWRGRRCRRASRCRAAPARPCGRRGSVSPPRWSAARIASSKLVVVRRAQTAEPRQGRTAPLNSVGGASRTRGLWRSGRGARGEPGCLVLGRNGCPTPSDGASAPARYSPGPE